MLVEIMKAIDRMGNYSKTKLAKKLNTSQEVVEHLLTKLEKLGYIKEENINSSQCNSCPSFKNGCMGAPLGKAIHALAITEKGRNFIQDH